MFYRRLIGRDAELAIKGPEKEEEQSAVVRSAVEKEELSRMAMDRQNLGQHQMWQGGQRHDHNGFEP